MEIRNKTYHDPAADLPVVEAYMAWALEAAEQVAGQPYALFLQKNIFEPLQMVDTVYDNTSTIIKNRADGYMSATANAEFFDPSILYAAGGLYSTVEDLFRWDQALYGDQLISKPLRDEMFASFAPVPPDFFGVSVLTR